MQEAQDNVVTLQALILRQDDVIDGLVGGTGLLRQEYRVNTGNATTVIASLVSMLGGETKITRDTLEMVAAMPNLGVHITAAAEDGSKTVSMIELPTEPPVGDDEFDEDFQDDYDDEPTDCDCPEHH